MRLRPWPRQTVPPTPTVRADQTCSRSFGLCVDGNSTAPCTTDDQCPFGDCDTDSGRCRCLLQSVERCSDGTVCLQDEADGRYYCVPGCNDTSECEGLVCSRESNQCVECTERSDCGDDEYCDFPENSCRPGCATDGDCGDNASCEGGVCRAVGDGVDSEGGGGCSVVGATPPAAPGLLLLVLALVAMTRRRHRPLSGARRG